jgi:hypothetical protein
MNTRTLDLTRFRKSLRCAGACAMVGALTLGAAVTSTAEAHNGPPASPLTGTWRVAVTTFNCATLVANPTFTSYLTFGADGTLVETTANPVFQPGQRSAGHGFWERTGRNFYRAASEAFIQFTTTAPLPPLTRGSQRIDQGIHMTGHDRFESDATVTFFNTAGAVLVVGCARAEGERLE